MSEKEVKEVKKITLAEIQKCEESTDFNKITLQIKAAVKAIKFKKSSDPHLTELPFIVLMSNGSFNPIHSEHVRQFEIAKEQISKKYLIVGGLICPSSDSYVKKKLGADAIPLTERCKMAFLATQDSDWISVCGFGNMRSDITARTLKAILEIKYSVDVSVIQMFGSDYRPSYTIWKIPVICFGRQGYAARNKEILEAIERKENVDGFHYIPEGVLNEVSSTKIRDDLKTYKKPPPSNHFFWKDMPLHPAVIDYIIEKKNKF